MNQNGDDELEPGLPAEIEAGIDKESAEHLLDEVFSKGDRSKYIHFVMAALGSIPWIGGVFAALAAHGTTEDQDRVNQIQRLWLQEHKSKISELSLALESVLRRLEGLGEEIQTRIESPEYLSLVRQVFRTWDQADTDEKKQMLQKLIANAGAIGLCPDDLIRLFISWINTYHEAHFLVVRAIYKNRGITRREIWDQIEDTRPREDSAEADLYRYLIRDLSTGGVIRQARETDGLGQFMTKDTRGQPKPKGSGPRPMESAFEGTKPYVLTALGEQFVHYVMEDVAPQISEHN